MIKTGQKLNKNLPHFAVFRSSTSMILVLRHLLRNQALGGDAGPPILVCSQPLPDVRLVQGGYHAVLPEPDSLDAHFLDTLAGGGWINDQELVWTLVAEAPGRVLELESRYGCLFDRTSEGWIHQKPFAGQTHDRTIHKGDLTGIEIMNRLSEQVLRRDNIQALEECRAVELLLDGAERCAGALVLDVRTGRFVVVTARATLLAMGGGPTMYKVVACSADKAADGIALAYRAGLPLRDMEMIQFHPTGLVIPDSLMTGALLEDGLR